MRAVPSSSRSNPPSPDGCRPATFHHLIAENRRNSLLLVVLFCLFTAVVVAVFGLAVLGIMAPDGSPTWTGLRGW